VDRLAQRLGLVPSTPPPTLVRDLTRFFLGGLIEERTRYLVALAQPGDVAADVTAGYEDCVLRALREQSTAHPGVNARRPPAALGAPERLYLPEPLAVEHFASPRAFSRLVGRIRSDLTWRGGLSAGPMPRRDAGLVGGAVLRAVQAVVVMIVRDEYAVSGPVPETAERLARELLIQLDAIAHHIQAVPLLRSLPDAEAELRVQVARSAGRVALPLRSIPTAPLTGDDVLRHYAGRADEEARRLARQIRHADGAILITGYRGVGKSSFVNRALYHAEAAQAEPQADGWLLVPVTVNLAKAAGVERILRLTLRAVRSALLDPHTADPRRIPGAHTDQPLPLRPEEITQLQEAYVRATLKVSLSRATVDEQRWDVGGKLSLDPGKLVGLELGKFISAGLSRSRADRINREVSLLDYDENAAEGDVAALIASLATLRPVAPGGPSVRIKLVFVFDELDKMNVDTGLKPMIEGLKNLFLQQHAVFMLITSKRLYYDLLKDRAVEDALLNSYFSAIVHVPLLTAAEARAMLDDWVDLPGSFGRRPAEERLLEELARFLTYRSFGNPRDIIRELRQMQEWADTAERPYLTERLAARPELPIFAALQQAIELLAAPATAPTPPADVPAVTLASERLGGDAARLEQVRRGLYILTEEIINRQTLPLTAATLKPLQRDNFSLLSVPDVLQLATRLGAELSALWSRLPAEVFAPLAPGRAPTPVPLFSLEHRDEVVLLRTAGEFYALTGREAKSAGPAPPRPAAPRTDADLVREAEALAEHGGRAERLTAIAIIGELGPNKLSPALKAFLVKVVRAESESALRLAALGRLTPEFVLADPTLAALASHEQDERALTLWIRLLAAASTPAARAAATTALLDMIPREASLTTERSDPVLVEILGALATVADRDLVQEVFGWLRRGSRSDAVLGAALSAIRSNAAAFGVNLSEWILSDKDVLEFFVTGPRRGGLARLLPTPGSPIKVQMLEAAFGAQPLVNAQKLLDAPTEIQVNDVLGRLWGAAFGTDAPEAARVVLDRLAAQSPAPAAPGDSTTTFPLFESRRLPLSLAAVPELQTKVMPHLRRALGEARDAGRYTPQTVGILERELDKLATLKPRAPLVLNPTTPYTVMLPREIPDPLFPFGNVPTGRFPSVPPSSPRPSAEYPSALLSSAIPLAMAFMIPWDLPPGAGWPTILAARVLVLLMDVTALVALAALLAPLVAPRDDAAAGRTTDVLELVWKFAPLAVIAALIEVHQRWIGPLSLWPQLGLFALNALGVGLAVYGLTGEALLPRPRRHWPNVS
jgi:hypothetical protein